MHLIALSLLAALLPQDIAVPPQPKFNIGTSVTRHVTITTLMCDSGEKSVLDITLRVTPKAIEEGGARLSMLLMEAAGKGSSTFAVRTDKNALPLECKMVGKDDEDQGLNGLIFFMRQPLWPTTPKAGSWTATIPNPLKPTESMKVACKVQRTSEGAKTLRLEERTGVLPLDGGISLQFTSVFMIDSETGAVVSLHEDVDMLTDGKKGQVISFDERD